LPVFGLFLACYWVAFELFGDLVSSHPLLAFVRQIKPPTEIIVPCASVTLDCAEGSGNDLTTGASSGAAVTSPFGVRFEVGSGGFGGVGKFGGGAATAATATTTPSAKHRLPKLETGRWGAAAVVVAGSKVVLVGGSNAGGNVDTCNVYDVNAVLFEESEASEVAAAAKASRHTPNPAGM
jgi:hypothetical protein